MMDRFARNSQGEWMMDWQPIETAPKDGNFFLAIRNEFGLRGHTIIYWSDCDGSWAGRNSEDEKRLVKYPPTHWIPLPGPPEGRQ